MKQHSLQTPDSLQLTYGLWEPATTPQAAILLAHGMAEHPGRYEELGNYLAERGYIVYAPAHRGHGATGHLMGKMGYFAPRQGWNCVLDDLSQIHQQICTQHPSLPIFGIGHSMGSFLMRCYIQNPHAPLQGVVLCGTAGPADIQIRFFSFLTRLLLLVSPPDRVIRWVNALGNRQTSHFIKNPRTPSDWISTDETKVDSYFADPDCGFPCTISFWRDLLSGWKQFSDPQKNRALDRNLPLLFLSGTQDPVGKFGKGVLQSGIFYQNLGMQSIEVRLYGGLRHALFEEQKRQEIFHFVYDWLEKRRTALSPQA